MNHKSDVENELEEFLVQEHSTIGDLYRKLPQPEPSAQLDQRILKHARQAFVRDASSATASATARKSSKRGSYARWPVALGSVATMVFAAGLALHFGAESWQTHDLAPAGASSAENVVHVRSIDMPEAKLAAADSATASNPAPAPAAESLSFGAAANKEANSVPRKANALSQSATVAAAAKISKPERRVEPPPATDIAATDRIAKAQLETSEVTRSNVRGMDVEGGAQSAPGFAVEPGRDDKTAAVAVKPTQRERDAVERKLDIATGRDAAFRARGSGNANPNVVDAAKQPASPVAAPPFPATQAPPMQASAAAAPVATSTPVLTADAWIAKIHAMLRNGQRAEAVDSLKQFREKYPDHILPPDLRAL